MNLPLYQDVQAPQNPDPNSNYGLWFERFYHAHHKSFGSTDDLDKSSKEKLRNKKDEWLKSCERSNFGDAFKSQLQATACRQLEMARSFGGDAHIFRCAGRFVSGTGNAHPLENGFSWHPTLGMPYLPGSAVKGLVRTVIETALDDTEQERGRILKLWFGTESKGDIAEQAGALIFLDALPVAPCDLKAEVLTPHMGKWYEKGSSTPLKADTQPGDWHAPVPVTYLAANNLNLQFTIMPRASAESVLMEEVWAALEYGLRNLGAGAKTAIGFGLFTPDQQQQLELEQQLTKHQQQRQEQQASKAREQLIANASPTQKILLELDDFIENLPDKMPASDARGAELWQRFGLALEAFSTSNTDEKTQLHDLIKGGKDRKYQISSKKDKEFKALLAQLKN